MHLLNMYIYRYKYMAKCYFAYFSGFVAERIFPKNQFVLSFEKTLRCFVFKLNNMNNRRRVFYSTSFFLIVFELDKIRKKDRSIIGRGIFPYIKIIILS